MGIRGTFAYHKIVQSGKGADEESAEQETKLKSNKIKINCPECGCSLKGATQEMIGDIGVCPKCKSEFTIEQKDENKKDE